MNVMFPAKLRKGTFSAATTTSIVVDSGFIATPISAYAIYCSDCSTFYQQMFEYVETVNTALNMIGQLQTQVEQHQNMVTQGAGLLNSMWGGITVDVKDIMSIYQRSQALGRNLQNLDQQSNTQAPRWQQYLNEAADSGQYPASQTMPGRYKTQSQQGRGNVELTMEAANMNASTFGSGDAQLDRMAARSQSVAGRVQAIRAGNKIASQNVQQLQKLRDLIAMQINLQGGYTAQEQGHRDLDGTLRTQRRSRAITQTGNNKRYQMLNIKVITLVLLLTGSAVIGGVGTAAYINGVSVTADATVALNCKLEQHPAEMFKRIDLANTGCDKGY